MHDAGLPSMSAFTVLLHCWPALVGPQLAAVTEPDELTADHTLYVRVLNRVWAPDLRAMTPRLLDRIQHGGVGPVRALRWVGRPMLQVIR
jgi:predicted nucleic acid-binding Zn ribbon protein